MTAKTDTSVESPDSGPMIETRGLTKVFDSVVALDDLSLRVPRGSIFGYLGPNGSGKTTTIRLLLALMRPTRGEVRVLGGDVHPGARVLSYVGALVERPAFYPYLSAAENLRLFATARGIPTPQIADMVALALRRVELVEVARRKVGGFSTGMQQRLGIALALLDDPPLVILDEPTTGLDPAGMIAVRSLIAELAGAGTTVFLSTHLLAEAEQLCTQLAVISRGQIVAAGATVDLFAARRRLSIRFTSPADRDTGVALLIRAGLAASARDTTRAEVDTDRDGSIAIRCLAEAGIYPSEVVVRQPSLEQVYLELTGAAQGDHPS